MNTPRKIFFFLLSMVWLSVSNPAPAACPPKRSTHYDGTSDAKISYGSALAFDSSVAMTVEAWVYRSDESRCETVVSRNFHQSYWFGFCFGKLRFYRSGGSFQDADRTVPARHWSHVAASYDGTQVSFFIDGQPAGVKPLANAGANKSESLYLGGDAEGDGFLGNLDEVRIWMLARSQPEIQADMYHELTSVPGLVLAVPKGGQAGPHTSEEVFGILPRELVVPRASGTVTVNGDVDPGGEYLGAEQLVIRYHEGADAADAVAYLVHDDNSLYIGVLGVRETSAGWPRSESVIGLNLDPNFSRDPRVQANDFRVRGWLNADPGTWGQGNSLGDFSVLPLDPARLAVAYAYCRGEFLPPCMEFRIDRSLLGQWTETDGIMIGHYNIDSAGHDLLAPGDAVQASPATWAPMSYADCSAATERITVRGSVTEDATGAPQAGHRVVLKSGADALHTIEIDSRLTDASGHFSFVDERVVQDLPIWVELEPTATGLTYLAPGLVTRGDTPTILFNRLVRYERCSAPGTPCDLGSVQFIVRFPINPSDVRVLAIEVNQAVQNRLFYPDGPGAFKSVSSEVPIVAGKDTLVRVYLVGRTRSFRGYDATLQSTFWSRTRTVGPRTYSSVNLGSDGLSLAADPAPVGNPEVTGSLRDELVRMRADAARTLNFIIPASDFGGEVVGLTLMQGTPVHGQIQLTLHSPVGVGLNFIRIINRRRLGEPVDSADIGTLESSIKQLYPISQVPVVITRDWAWSGAVWRSASFGAAPRPVAANSDDLLMETWSTFGGDDTPGAGLDFRRNILPTFGLARNLPPTSDGSSISGIAWINGEPGGDEPLRRGGTGLSMIDRSTLAHEIGHTIGFEHVSNAHGEAAGGGWEDWTRFGYSTDGALSPRTDVLGSFGADVQRAPGGGWSIRILDPCPLRPGIDRAAPCDLNDPAYDPIIPHEIMSYGGDPWVSSLTYERIYGFIRDGRVNPAVRPASLADGAASPASEARAEALLIRGVFLPDGSLELYPLTQKPLPVSLVGKTRPGSLTCNLLDGDGQTLQSVAFAPVRADDDESAVRGHFALALPVCTNLRTLRILENNAVLADRQASAHPPSVRLLSPVGGEQFAQGNLHVAWKVADEDNDPVFSLVQYSPDGGQRWQGIKWVNPGEPFEADVALRELIPGENARIRVVASDGMNITVAESPLPFSVGEPYQWDSSPRLRIDHQNSNVVLLWEARRQAAMVQKAPAVNGPWEDVARGLTTDGRNYAMVVPISQSAWFFRLKMMSESCFDLGGFPLGEVPNPWEISGLKFVSRLAGGSEATQGSIVWEDGQVGYDIPYQLEVEFTESCEIVDLDLQEKSGLVELAAYDDAGAVVDSSRLEGMLAGVQHVTFQALGTPIKRIIITSPNALTQLLSLCCRSNPVNEPANPPSLKNQ